MHHSRWVCFVVWSCVRRFSTSCPSDQAMLNADTFHRYAMRFQHHGPTSSSVTTKCLKKVWKVFCIDTWEESRDNQAYRECTGADWSGERVQVVKANATHLHEKQGESFVCSWKITQQGPKKQPKRKTTGRVSETVTERSITKQSPCLGQHSQAEGRDAWSKMKIKKKIKISDRWFRGFGKGH